MVAFNSLGDVGRLTARLEALDRLLQQMRDAPRRDSVEVAFPPAGMVLDLPRADVASVLGAERDRVAVRLGELGVTGVPKPAFSGH